MKRQHKILRKLFTRRVIALITLAALLTSVLPLSVPSNHYQDNDSLKKDQSQPFPCMNRPCGCNTADQCWKKCCCFNKAEKLAWARKNGVTPPAFLTSDDRSSSFISNHNTASPEAKKSCCQSKKESKQIVSTTLPVDTSLCGVAKRCCSQKNVQSCCDKKRSQRREKSQSKTVIGILAQKCHGFGYDWTTLPWLTFEKPVTITFAPDLEDSVKLISLSMTEHSDPPALPPPEC